MYAISAMDKMIGLRMSSPIGRNMGIARHMAANAAAPETTSQPTS
jgi:hypothetical protein